MSISQKSSIACLKAYSLFRWKEDLNQGESFPKNYMMLMRGAWLAQSEEQAILHLKVVSSSPIPVEDMT